MLSQPHRFSLVMAAALLLAAGLLWAGELRPSRSDAPAPAATTAPTTLAAPPVTRPATVTVPILVYHNVRSETPPGLSEYDRQYELTPTAFAAQLEYLQAGGYESVSVSQLVDYLQTGIGPWPAKPVLITFDDGRQSQWTAARPLLAAYGYTATFFVFTNAPDRNDNYLTWSELNALHDAGHEIASHTVLHPYLTKLDDADLATELADSRADIAAGVGEPARALAYPFGLTDERVTAAAAAAGYEAARGLRHYVDITAADLLDLPGYIIPADLDYFRAVVAGRVVDR